MEAFDRPQVSLNAVTFDRAPSRRVSPRAAICLGLVLSLVPIWGFSSPSRVCVIIMGLGGMPEYEENFTGWAERLEKFFREEPETAVYFLDGREKRREDVLELWAELESRPDPEELWLFLIGHGTFDGRFYKLNIRGPDITDEDLAAFLDRLEARRTFVIAATSASGALLRGLPGPGRAIVTATRHERQRQPPLFLSFFLEAVTSAEADANKDGRVSLLEAFEYSRKNVEDWYESRGRIQTEHPVLEDRAEGLLAAGAFLSTPPAQAYRTLEAQELARDKTRVEREIEDLKYRKGELSEGEYFRQLEQLLVQLATLSEKISELEGAP